MNIKSKALEFGLEQVSLERLTAAFTALMLGSFLFFGVAFASPMEVHNAAHDMRHVMSFPCH